MKTFTKYPSKRIQASTASPDKYKDMVERAIDWATQVSDQTASDLIRAMKISEKDLKELGFDLEG